MKPSHLDDHGQAHMVDVSGKIASARQAIARATVQMGEEAWKALRHDQNAKGDVLSTARIAGIMAAKNTAQLIPLCHSLGLDQITIDFNTEQIGHLCITAQARLVAKTGVEMEVMTAVSVAALTVYDMLKALEKGISITEVLLLHKSGGKSGTWNHDDSS